MITNPLFQYSPITEPVQIDTASVAGWWQPLSEPVRRNPLNAIVLAAAIGFVGPVLVPPPPTDVPWFQALSEPVRYPLRLHPDKNPELFFLDIAPFIPIIDPFVETKRERQKRKKLEERYQREQEEIDFKQQRRIDIAEALLPKLEEIKWTGRPAIVVSPQTGQLTEQILQAKLKAREIQALDDEEELAQILRDL